MRRWGVEYVLQLVVFLVAVVAHAWAVARAQDPGRPGGTNWLMTLDAQSGGSFQGTAGSVVAEGRVDDVRVAIRPVQDNKSRIGVTCDGPRLHPKLVVRPELIFGNRDLQTGDEAFDRRFALRGPAHVLAAVLGGPLRRRLMSLADRGVRVEVRAGSVEVSRGWNPRDAAGIGEAAKDAVYLLEALAVQPADLAPRLAERAADREEPLELRVLAADCLFGRAPRSEPALAVADALVAEGPVELLFAVGRGVGRMHAGARERLSRLAASDTEGRVHRAEAVAILGRLADPGLRPLFDALIASSPPEVRAAAVQAVAQMGVGAAGGLAIADGDAGAVAVVPDQRGAVTIKQS